MNELQKVRTMTNTPPQVSIVIPTFNRAHFVGQAIDSALSQSVACEVIVCDHGSTDGTPEVVRGYGDRVTYVRRERDFGPHFCWLEGVLHASGTFVHLQFDDDWLESTFIEACMEVMTEETGFAFSAVALYDEDEGRVTRNFFDNVFPASGVYPNRTLEKLLLRKLISPGAMIYRRQDALDALYQGNLPLARSTYHGVGPDCFISLLCLLRYPRCGYVRDPLAVFRGHGESITMDASADPERARRLAAAYEEVREYYRQLKRIKRSGSWMRALGLKR